MVNRATQFSNCVFEAGLENDDCPYLPYYGVNNDQQCIKNSTNILVIPTKIQGWSRDSRCKNGKHNISKLGKGWPQV